MDVRGSSQSLIKVDAEALAVPVFKGEEGNNEFLKELDKAVGGVISAVIKAEEFAAKEGETAYFPGPGRGQKTQRLLLIGCGERKDYKARQVSQMAGTAARFLRSKNARTIAIVPRASEDAERAAQYVIAGAIMGLFEPDKYRTKDKEQREIKSFEVVIDGADKQALQRGVQRGGIIGASRKIKKVAHDTYSPLC